MNLPGRNSAVIVKEVPEGAILFSTETEVYFSLNPIGIRVWRLLSPECKSLDEVVGRIHDEYPDVSPETIASDVRALLADLGSHGLIDTRQAS